MQRVPVVLAWLAGRAYLLWLLVGPERWVVGDPHYYRLSLVHMAAAGPAHTLVEYPVPALALLYLPFLAVHALGHLIAYDVMLALCAIAIDLTFGVALLREGAKRPPARSVLGAHPAQWAWVLALPAIGATAYARFDLIPGILVGLAVLCAAQRPGVAAALGALATGTKYWPAIVVPALLTGGRSRRVVALTTALCGSLLVVFSVWWAGWQRLWTPLAYLQHRGLQIESVAATPAMLQFGLHPGEDTVRYAASHAFEVHGPAVGLLLQLSTVASVSLALTLMVLWTLAWRRMRRSDVDIDVLVWVVLAAVGGFIVTGKVFSPQYLLWLLPAATAGLVVVRAEATRRRLLAWSGVLLIAAFATQELFPLHYRDLLVHDSGTKAAVTLLALRNALVAALFGYALLQALRLVVAKPSRPSREGALVSVA